MKKITLLTLFLVLFATTVKSTDYPFVLTTDPQQPVLYYIYSGRDSNGGTNLSYVFANEIPWGDTMYRLQIVRQDPRGMREQMWYFMAEGEGVKIISAADHRMITVPSTTDAPKCTLMQTADELTSTHYIWLLDCTNGCYSFKTSDGKSFLSHNGNWQTASATMGLYNANGSQDEGSRVFFETIPTEDTHITALPAVWPTRVIYSLSGQRFSNITTPGIYIIEGKKVKINR